MDHVVKPERRRGWLRTVSLGVFLAITAACADAERLGPTAEADPVTDPSDMAAATQPGIVFSSAALTVSQINSVHTGLVAGPTPSGMLTFLSQLRAKGGRVLIKLARGDKSRNSDGTFNLTKWKAEVDRFQGINFSSSPGTWAASQVNKAKSKGLGLVTGLNVLDGGDGSSGIRGTQNRTWAMSAAEVRKYGSALLGQSYVCAFSMWRYSGSYYGRADVKSAMADLSAKARSHARTSCRQ